MEKFYYENKPRFFVPLNCSKSSFCFFVNLVGVSTTTPTICGPRDSLRKCGTPWPDSWNFHSNNAIHSLHVNFRPQCRINHGNMLF